MKAIEILDTIKNNDVQLAINDNEGYTYCNKETDNIMDIFGLTNENDLHFYGVYSDVVGGQIDSRNYNDETILTAIEKMLNLGTIVERGALNHGKNFKRTYFWNE